MDPRIRALLEPKTFAKGKKSVGRKSSEASSDTPFRPDQANEGSRSSPPSDTSPVRSVPIYDPKKLLDPRGLRKAAPVQKPNSYTKSIGSNSSVDVSATHTPHLNRENSGSRSMIEDLYGVERRTDRPVKRTKLSSDGDNIQSKGKGNARTFQSSGIIGDYMRPNADNQGPTTDQRKVVDLTNDDDANESDDDVQVVKSRNIANEQEVCFGCIATNVHAHAVPKPRKTTNIYGELHQWPLIKCSVLRVPSKDTVIEVKDVYGFIFGRVEPDIANILAPMVDGLKKFRLDPWLPPRKKKSTEQEHQPCSETMLININVYGRRIDVERIGRILGQRNVWLKSPVLVNKDCEIVNPHADRFRSVVQQSKGAVRSNHYSETRTVEEATEAVTKLFDHYANTARPLEETEPGPLIVTPLLLHQKQALTFMLQREQPRTYGATESDNSSLWRKKRKNNGLVYYEETVTGITLKEEPDEVFGGLLADVMGLGKTLEALSLIACTNEEAIGFGSETLIRKDSSEAVLMAQSKATLIVAPVSTVKNWEDQISEHIKPGTFTYYVYHGSNREKNPQKLAQYDIVISTYSTIAFECSAKSQSDSPIRAIRWFRVILDEAHTIRESKASQSQAMYSLFAQRRWCLTGTPIQNRLDDLGSLTRFLRLYPYDTTMRFNQYVRSPAQSGDENYLKSLRVFIDSFTLRRLKDRIDLPDRKDLIERLDLSSDECTLHLFFQARAHLELTEMSEERQQRTVSQHHVLRAIMTLRLICDHGRELLKDDDLEAFKGTSVADAIDVDIDGDSRPRRITAREAYESLALLAEADLDLCKQCDKKISGDSPRAEAEIIEDIRGYMLPCFDLICVDCFKYDKGVIDDMGDDKSMACPFCQESIMAQYIAIPKTTAELLEVAPEDSVNQTEDYKRGTYTGPSTKVNALLDDLNEIRDESDVLVGAGESPLKSIVFSEFTSNLDLIERALNDHGFEGSFVRIDGSMSLNKRKAVLDSLNVDNTVTILLASIKAAGQGLNLTAASRAFIMEPMWNPAAETQAVDRIYRIGQKRNVVVKRYQMKNSIEEKIVELQRKKQALADISMNKNHKLLSKKETRETQMKEILALFK